MDSASPCALKRRRTINSTIELTGHATKNADLIAASGTSVRLRGLDSTAEAEDDVRFVSFNTRNDAYAFVDKISFFAVKIYPAAITSASVARPSYGGAHRGAIAPRR